MQMKQQPPHPKPHLLRLAYEPPPSASNLKAQMSVSLAIPHLHRPSNIPPPPSPSPLVHSTLQSLLAETFQLPSVFVIPLLPTQLLLPPQPSSMPLHFLQHLPNPDLLQIEIHLLPVLERQTQCRGLV